MVIFTLLGGAYCWFYFDNVHFHVTHAYAHMGYDVAQHQIGQRYLHGQFIQNYSCVSTIAMNMNFLILFEAYQSY